MIERVKLYDEARESILELLNALNDPTRQEIVFLFQKQPEFCVNDIARQFSLSRPAISHHLNLMRRAKILNSRKEGKEVYYSFNKEHVLNTLELMTTYFKGCC
ncbi:MAG: winged helix-turn-helix transcriptional regulator [Chlorobiaceae bacterium]|nr:winged helix-turn-helix transcriptional regulator [Chlorobiaceae bacterium]NTW74885.1 winged helix-turn-helix transcriptional regulator [Chlorobiaceae bacterium]